MKPWKDWNNTPLRVKEDMIAYSQIREHEEAEQNSKFLVQLAKAIR